MSYHSYETPKKMGVARLEPAQILAVVTAACLALSVSLPMLRASGTPGSHDVSLADGSGRLVAYVLISAGVVFAGAFAGPHGARGMALAGGAAAPIAGLFAFAGALAYVMYDKRSLIGAMSLGPGFYAICASVGTCVALFVMSVRQRDKNSLKRDGVHAVVGVISAAGMTLGTMLSPGKSGTSFMKMNFGWSSWQMQIAWLLFVVLVGTPGFVGFAMRTVWGADLALGALLAPAWLVLTGLAPASAPSLFDFTFRTVHPVVVIALAGQVVAQVLFRLTSAPRWRWPARG